MKSSEEASALRFGLIHTETAEEAEWEGRDWTVIGSRLGCGQHGPTLIPSVNILHVVNHYPITMHSTKNKCGGGPYLFFN